MLMLSKDKVCIPSGSGPLHTPPRDEYGDVRAESISVLKYTVEKPNQQPAGLRPDLLP